MAEAVPTLCVTENCTKEADIYCSVCERLFCGAHNQAHGEFLKMARLSHHMITVEEYKQTGTGGENSSYCKQHDKSEIMVACEHCYQPMCPKCYDDAAILKKCSAEGKVLDEPINIPIRLSETPSNTNTPTTLSNPAIPVLPLPTRLQYRESQTAPNRTYCVYFTREGKLLNSGWNYGISGLPFTPKIPTDDNRRNYSICENNHHLYLLQYHHEHYQHYVHKINLSDQTVSENIIKSIGFSRHLVVSDEFIIISHETAECVRVYSSKNSAHLFNLKHECISEEPVGVGLLGDSLVVGDYDQNQVSNMTISETPEVRWTCTDITKPSALRVVENPQMILVGSDYTKQIYVLSYQGQKLSTLTVPECLDFIDDIAVYGKQIAVADSTNQIKVYEITE